MKPTTVTIPDELKEDVPHTGFGKILSATPVVMAVVATMLAGLASSEMTRAQYRRSLGAQQQSKAGDQWSFFQAKRLRGAIQGNTVDLLENTTEVHPFNAQSLKDELKVAALLNSSNAEPAIHLLERGELPALAPAPVTNSKINAAIEGIESGKPDPELAAMLSEISDQELADALKAARDHVQSVDDATRPVNEVIDKLDDLLEREKVGVKKISGSDPSSSIARDFTVARLKYAARRYEVEARLNQAIANLYELQVRKSNIAAERHHARSERFFFGMLAAQAGVIISTFAMATKKRNLLWSLAAGAGLLAIAFAVYVYLYV
jgi:hypothetical protein